MGGLLLFLVCWRRGRYIAPDQQGDTLFLTHLPRADSPLELDRLTVCLPLFTHPLFPKFFFFTERAVPYSQAQLYWAGRTAGWMAD
jgi:hypothetical protein